MEKLKHNLHRFVVGLNLKLAIVSIEQKHKERLEVNEMAHQLTFFRQYGVNGYQLDEAAFKKIETHRYMNG